MPQQTKPLSPPQFRLLAELHCAGSKHCVDYYEPARILVRRGLARWERADHLAITEDGRKFIDAGGLT